jgi:hypothetical protein
VAKCFLSCKVAVRKGAEGGEGLEGEPPCSNRSRKPRDIHRTKTKRTAQLEAVLSNVTIHRGHHCLGGLRRTDGQPAWRAVFGAIISCFCRPSTQQQQNRASVSTTDNIMFMARPATASCRSSRQLCAAAATPRTRACRQQLLRPGALTFVQPGLCDVPTAAETPDTRSASSTETHTPLSSPAADSEVAHSDKAVAGQRQPAPPVWTLQAEGNRVMAAVRSKMLLCAGAAVMLLGVACSGELEQQPTGRALLAPIMCCLRAACTNNLKQSAASPQTHPLSAS